MSHGVFITGTDTGIGKSRVSVALLRQLAGQGVQVAGFKPVAAGAEPVAGQRRNEDALALQAATTIDVTYDEINPVCLDLPASPHIAAACEGVNIELAPLAQAGRALAGRCQLVVAEGAGGWLVPLSDSASVASLARELGWPVILVVGMRLGCINHALLSMRAMQADGVVVAGWIANHLDPQLLQPQAVRHTLIQQMGVPLLADLAFAGDEMQWTAAGKQWLQKILQIVFDRQK